jgi:hypothetical protein
MTARISLDRTSVLVVGAWNPAIVLPHWLLQSKVVEAASEQVMVDVNPRTRQYGFTLGDFRWLVDDNKLGVRALKSLDCGVFLARVLALLPHTPVDAVRTSFVYKCTAEQWPKHLKPGIGDLTLDAPAAKVKFEQYGWTGVKNIESGRMQISVTQQPKSDVVIACSLHRNVDNATAAAQFAGSWSRDLGIVLETLNAAFEISQDEQSTNVPSRLASSATK